MRSLLSSTAPRLRATLPPKGSMFSLKSFAQLTRAISEWPGSADDRPCRGLARVDVVRQRGPSRREAGPPEDRAVSERLPRNVTMFVSSMVTKLFASMSSRSNDTKKNVRSRLEGPAKGPAELLLAVGRLLAIDRLAGRVELLEVLLAFSASSRK